MKEGFFIFSSLFLIPIIGTAIGQLTLLRSLTETIVPLLPKPAILETCPANPPLTLRFSPPFANCEETAKQGLLWKHPFTSLNTSQILDYYGYPFQTYHVTTSDGYILTVYRVLGPPNSEPVSGKQAVLLQHGAIAASDNWLFQWGTRNLVSKLTEAGYEVWLGNSRGTSYSMEHVTLNSNDLRFWNFSFHEVAVFDVPSVVDLILSETGQEKIFYIGHSFGTSAYLAGLSELPELNDKIIAGFLFAPIGIIGHMNNPTHDIIRFAAQGGPISRFFNGAVDLGVTTRQRIPFPIGDFCNPTAVRCGVCNNLIFFVYGYNAPQLNTTDLPNIIEKTSNTVSGKTILHYGQLVGSCDFRKYDYGSTGNQELYGSSIPPKYQVENIRVPTYLLYGEQDIFGPPNDVQLLAKLFSPGVVREVFRVDDDLFNHLDFMVAKDADKLVYNHVIEEMGKFK